MKKKLISIVLCVVFTFGCVLTWDQADTLAKRFNTSATPYEMAAVVLLFAALCCSVVFNEERKNTANQ
jgi:hypothetical protein